MKNEIAREFYKNYNNGTDMLKLNWDIIDLILQENPNSVFEFGCGTGKILYHLLQMNPSLDILGNDISQKAINTGKDIFGLDIINSDESLLARIENNRYDVVFTCSVLNHIPDIDYIVPHLQRISKKTVFLAECQQKTHDYFFPHNYKKFGFKKLDYLWFSGIKVYDIWKTSV